MLKNKVARFSMGHGVYCFKLIVLACMAANFGY